jgi:ribosomal small subunit protein bTHX
VGKGDRRSGKGKRFRASYGNTRRRKRKTSEKKQARTPKKRAG